MTEVDTRPIHVCSCCTTPPDQRPGWLDSDLPLCALVCGAAAFEHQPRIAVQLMLVNCDACRVLLDQLLAMGKIHVDEETTRISYVPGD